MDYLDKLAMKKIAQDPNQDPTKQPSQMEPKKDVNSIERELRLNIVNVINQKLGTTFANIDDIKKFIENFEYSKEREKREDMQMLNLTLLNIKDLSNRIYAGNISQEDINLRLSNVIERIIGILSSKIAQVKPQKEEIQNIQVDDTKAALQALSTKLIQESTKQALLRSLYPNLEENIKNAFIQKGASPYLANALYSLLKDTIWIDIQTMFSTRTQTIDGLNILLGEEGINKLREIAAEERKAKQVPSNRPITFNGEIIYKEIKDFLIERLIQNFSNDAANVALKNFKIAGLTFEELNEMNSMEKLKVYAKKSEEEAAKDKENLDKLDSKATHVVLGEKLFFLPMGKNILLDIWLKNFTAGGDTIINLYMDVATSLSKNNELEKPFLSRLIADISAITRRGSYQAYFGGKMIPLREFLPAVSKGVIEAPQMFYIKNISAEEGLSERRDESVARAISSFVDSGLFPPYGQVSSSDKWTYHLGAARTERMASINNYLSAKITTDLFAIFLVSLATRNDPLSNFVKGAIRLFRPDLIEAATSPTDIKMLANGRANYISRLKEYLFKEGIEDINIEKIPTAKSSSNFLSNIVRFSAGSSKPRLFSLDSMIDKIIKAYKSLDLDLPTTCLIKRISANDANFVLFDITFVNHKFKDPSIFSILPESNDINKLLSLTIEEVEESGAPNLGDSSKPLFVIKKDVVSEGTELYPRVQVLIPSVNLTLEEKEKKVPENSRIFSGPRGLYYASPANLNATQALRIQRIIDLEKQIRSIMNKNYRIVINNKDYSARSITALKALTELKGNYIKGLRSYLLKYQPNNILLKLNDSELKEYLEKYLKETGTLPYEQEHKEYMKEINFVLQNTKGIQYMYTVLSMIKTAIKIKPFEVMNYANHIENFLEHLSYYINSITNKQENKIYFKDAGTEIEKNIINYIEDIFGKTDLYKYIPIPETSLKKEYDEAYKDNPEKGPAAELLKIFNVGGSSPKASKEESETPNKKSNFLNIVFSWIKKAVSNIQIENFVFIYSPSKRIIKEESKYDFNNKVSNLQNYLRYHISLPENGIDTVRVILYNALLQEYYYPLSQAYQNLSKGHKDIQQYVSTFESLLNEHYQDLRTMILSYSLPIFDIIEKIKFLVDVVPPILANNNPARNMLMRINKEIFNSNDKSILSTVYYLQLQSLKEGSREVPPSEIPKFNKRYEKIVNYIKNQLGDIPRIAIVDKTLTPTQADIEALPEKIDSQKIKDILSHLSDVHKLPNFKRSIIPINTITHSKKESVDEIVTKYNNINSIVNEKIKIQPSVISFIADTLTKGIGLIVRLQQKSSFESMHLKRHKPKQEPPSEQGSQSAPPPQTTTSSNKSGMVVNAATILNDLCIAENSLGVIERDNLNTWIEAMLLTKKLLRYSNNKEWTSFLNRSYDKLFHYAGSKLARETPLNLKSFKDYLEEEWVKINKKQD